MSDVGVDVKPPEIQAFETVECSEMVFESGNDFGGEPPSEVVAEGESPHVGRYTICGIYLQSPP